jgi:8-oxo-dGTP diphosphatase
VYRSRYRDWTLPKGKAHPGESLLACAVREVREETGAQVAVSRRLAAIRYPVEDGSKAVTFWAMRYVGGEFTPSAEVEELRWLPVTDAPAELSYDRERSVLEEFAARPAPQSVVALVRHAKAGSRREWAGDDALRPLDDAGRVQARMLAKFLCEFSPTRIVSADRMRCVQTVEPLARVLGLDVEIEPGYADEGYLSNPDAARTELLALAKSVPASVVCSQGSAVPGLVRDLTRDVPPESFTTRKAAFWALSFAEGMVVGADYYDPPTP